MAGSRAARQKVVGAFWSATTSTVRAFGRVLHTLFLEVTGLLFTFLMIGFVSVTVREYDKYKAGAAPAYKAALAGFFGVMFLWFGISSFWRARKHKSRK